MTASRPAYTLLEMTLALAISLIILGGTYEFLNRQMTLSEAGREAVEDAALARVILDRMAADIVASLGGVDPQQLPDASEDAVEATFNNGVEGSSSVLILPTSRVPRELLASDKRRLDSNDLPQVSDLRRISYWFVEDGGLARQEVTAVTSDDLNSKPPDVADAAKCVIAKEVTAVAFEFHDGTPGAAGWVSTWNGAAYAGNALDGAAPLGPPAAIRITLTIKGRDGLRTREFRRVVALPAGNNFPFQQQQSGL